MRRALELARRGRGAVGTNPLVGAVVVRGAKVVGEGWHARYGGPHAEAVALAKAGIKARGATLYVTLEPCSRVGKTPPCTRMIIASRVRRVVFACPDPNERGRGSRELRRHGLTVIRGVLEKRARELNSEFFTRIRTRRPYLILKLAETLDGKIADSRGRSRWISSPEARVWTRGLRNGVDAVMVGAGTAVTDDPRLTAPGAPAGNQPVRIVVDSRARVPPSARLFAPGKVLVAVTGAAPRARVAALATAGAEIMRFPASGGRVPLRALMRALYAGGVGSILCEGGGALAGALVDGGLVDRVVMVISPRILGGSGSRSAITGIGRRLASALILKQVEVRRLGRDVVVDGLVRGT